MTTDRRNDRPPGGLLPHQIRKRHTNGVGDTDESVQLRRRVPLLDPAIGSDVDAGPTAHVELGEVVEFADVADLFPHFAAAGDDPVVGWGGTRHPSTLTTP